MFILLLLLVSPFLATGLSQDTHSISVIKGVVTTDETLEGNHLTVNLIDTAGHKSVDRAFVAGDGNFEFHAVRPGSYQVELTAPSGETISKTMQTLNSYVDRIELKLPVRENKAGPTGTVSVRQLQLSEKAKRIFAQAQKASAARDYTKANGILRGALKEDSAIGYARLNMGANYMKADQPASAIPEFQEAVRLMPDDVMSRTNLALAFLWTRKLDEAEVAARGALAIDRNCAKAQWALGAILLANGLHVEEGLENLRLASREIPRARVMVAQYYAQRGQKDAAARELREYLAKASGADKASAEQWLSKLVAK
jgi:tetratricopeptide (TPR) repeat protein